MEDNKGNTMRKPSRTAVLTIAGLLTAAGVLSTIILWHQAPEQLPPLSNPSSLSIATYNADTVVVIIEGDQEISCPNPIVGQPEAPIGLIPQTATLYTGFFPRGVTEDCYLIGRFFVQLSSTA